MDAWGIDVVLTASQKGIGAPPGLSIVVASEKALAAFNARTVPVPAFYASWKRWLPIMQGYEKGAPAYFATPPVNLIYALHQALTQITRGAISIEDRFKGHQETSARVKAAAKELGLGSVPVDPSVAANGMTAVRLLTVLRLGSFPTEFTTGLLPRRRQVLGACAGLLQEGSYHRRRPWYAQGCVLPHRVSYLSQPIIASLYTDDSCADTWGSQLSTVLAAMLTGLSPFCVR